MLEAQINQARDMILRLNKLDHLRKKGLSFETIEIEYPGTLVTYAELDSWGNSVQEIIVILFGDDSDYEKQWTRIPTEVPRISGDSSETSFIRQLDYSISFINKIETIIKIKNSGWKP